MTAWRERVDELLFEGETVESEVDVGSAHVAVTSHRVLAFTPNVNEERFRQVDRPNVEGVAQSGVDRVEFRERAAKAGVAGLLFAGIGAVFEPTAYVSRPDLSGVEGAGSISGVLGLAQGMLDAFFALDDALLVGGLLLLVVALGLFGTQLALRKSRLAIVVAGEEPILLPDAVDDATVEQLRAALAPPDAAGESGHATGGPSHATARPENAADEPERSRTDASGSPIDVAEPSRTTGSDQ